MIENHVVASGRTPVSLTAIVEGLALFLITLQSYYFYSIGLALFPIIGAVLLLIVGAQRPISLRKIELYIFAFLTFIVCFSIVSVVNTANYKTVLSTPVLFSAVLGTYWCYWGRLHRLVAILRIVLVVHLFAFYFQMITWLIFGEFLDLLEPVTGEAQRFLSQKGILIDDVRAPRFTGLFNEPGTYSVWIYTILAMIVILQRTLDKLVIIGALSILMTLSLYGFVLVAVLGMCFLIFSRGLGWVKIVPIPIVYLAIWPAIDARLGSEYSGIDFRWESLATLAEMDRFLCGNICSSEAVVNSLDVGLYVSLTHDAGILYLLSFIGFSFVAGMFSSLSSFLLISALMLTKIKLSYPLIWVVFTVLCIKTHQVSVDSDATST